MKNSDFELRNLNCYMKEAIAIYAQLEAGVQYDEEGLDLHHSLAYALERSLRYVTRYQVVCEIEEEQLCER